MLDSRLFNPKTKLSFYSCDVWRMVECQETAATLSLVDTIDEQLLLEDLIDRVKPNYRTGTENMHYLLKTAFRYPPLKYGSRFGSRKMPSFFYASEEQKTVLAEVAYYRFIFLDDMDEPYPGVIDSKHAMFAVRVTSKACLDLAENIYQTIREDLIHPSDYSACQAIGDWAINEKAVDIIRYESARKLAFHNVAVAQPATIRSPNPKALQNWLCRTESNCISFSSRENGSFKFSIELFKRNGKLARCR